MKDLSERRVSSRLVYDGRLLKVRSDTVRLPDGAAAEREWIEHPGAVAVIAVTDAGELLMERQFRYALGRDMFEIPAGKIDPGEDPLETGRRELQEETGYTAAERTHVATIHLAIGYSNERIEIYLAKGLEHAQAKLDDESSARPPRIARSPTVWSPRTHEERSAQRSTAVKRCRRQARGSARGGGHRCLRLRHRRAHGAARHCGAAAA